MLALGAKAGVRVERGDRALDVLLGQGRRGAVIDEAEDGQLRREFRNSAVVVCVKVRDEQVVDARDAGGPRGGQDAVRVARRRDWSGKRSEASVARVAGVDEQRFAARRGNQSRLSA